MSPVRTARSWRARWRSARQATEARRIFDCFEGHTMLSREAYVANLELARSVLGVPGAVVECGVWRGGMIAGLARILGPRRDYFLFDSFEGLPPARDIDGEAAKAWQRDVTSPEYFDNCTAEETTAREAMELAGIKNPRITKGWFETTLGTFPDDTDIALLRLDGDWFESTMTCLEALFPRVATGGIVIVDDYYAWDGCSRAVHAFLHQQDDPHKIRQYRDTVAFIRK